ncbi:ABC transporter ATP-binding protein [Aureimonas psammosilenae]|uniref:ABC transporter ATP-binding protein n=1 Tax=Aureimonas psammosilenae TaxID=2495496 RepID=UPI00126049A2|nr:ABC transporter ATP-binding protein [Aureimonas psammosilenae]
MSRNDISLYADRPVGFLLCYARRRPVAHAVIVAAVLSAVAFSISTQYGVKFLVDALSAPAGTGAGPWVAFALLVFFIAADNFLWRIATWVASHAFVGVTGDLRSDLFRHLTGHAPSYFTERLPGVLTSRVTATSNAVFQIENMVSWNVLPPIAATVGAILFLGAVSVPMAATLVVVAGLVMLLMFRMAAAGRPLHHEFAARAAAVDGEMVDIIGNMPLVKAFGGIVREHGRFDAKVVEEMGARRSSLLYLERLRLTHAVIVVVMTIALLAWSISLWQKGQATPGDVVLVTTLGISILSATRDLAVALVDVTQHMARLSEALQTLLSPHEMRDHPEASALKPEGARVTFDEVSFAYKDGRRVFDRFNLEIEPGQRVGIVGESGGGKSTLVALLQRFHDLETGHIAIDGHDIVKATEDSLRRAITVVPQDTALLNRTLMENIRYGRPDATEDEIRFALAAARCEDFVDGLPEGLQTLVGDRGTKLSGGQRQRIAIARAFLKDAPILVLDEATSALDTQSEEAIREALERLMAGGTVIAIAHRLSTLRNYDRILVLSHGRLAQDGPPDVLLQEEGPYRDLVNRELGRLGEPVAVRAA